MNEILEIVKEINAEIRDCDDSEIAELIYYTDGLGESVEFLGETIWNRSHPQKTVYSCKISIS